MTSHPAAPSRKFPWLDLAVLLAALLGFVAWDVIGRSRHLLEVSDRYGVTVDAPREDAGSPTGYADGRRSLLLPSADTAHWVMQTQAMVATGDWRSRQVGYDNAPDGREVHWAAPLHWWLAGLAWVDHEVSGRPIGIAIERATLAAGPVLFVLLLLGFIPWLAWKFSRDAAYLAALAFVVFYPFYIDFLPGRTDHHMLANICGLLTVLGLAGSATAPTWSSARRWLAGSAVAGGTGLWISAATQVPVLIGLGLGGLAASWLGRSATRRPAWLEDPGLWRFWGLVGGGVSLGAWLLEYFPSHLGLRLEVNHPLYAVAWIGAGEVLRVVGLACRDGNHALPRRDRLAGGIGLLLVFLLPAVMAVTRAKTFVVTDPFVWQLHSLYISEFGSLGRTLVATGPNRSSLALVLPMLLVAPALWLVLRRSTPPEARAQLAAVLLPALLGWGLGWYQVRWLGLACALSVPVLAVFFQVMESFATPRRLLTAWSLALGLLLLPSAMGVRQRSDAGREFTPEEIHALAERDVAHWLRQRSGGERVVVAGTPTPTTNLIALGGLTGLDTLYWENAAGLKKAAALFAAPSPAAARELAGRFGVTHIVLFSWDAFEVSLAKLSRGLPEAAPIPADLFIANLLSAPVPPPWLHAVPFPLPDHAALQKAQVRIWEVVPEQTSAAATARAAGYHLELGQPVVAARFAPLLAAFPEDLAANVMQAGIASRQGDQAAFATVFGRVLAELPRADALALDEQVALATVLAMGRRPELARAHLQRAVQSVDERSLRHLSASSLGDLLVLTEGLGIVWPDPALPELARRLMPPNRRQ